MNRLSLVGRVAVLATAVAIGVGVIVAAALIAVISLRRAEVRESRTQEVSSATLRAENVAVNLESALRGYTLTGNPGFESLFVAAKKQVPVAFRDLESRLSDDREQFQRARAARLALTSYVDDFADPMIQIRKVSPSSARQAVATAEDRRQMRPVRSRLTKILQVEQSRAAGRADHAESVARSAIIAGSVGLVVSAALVLLFGAWVARGVAAPVRRTSAAATQVARGDFDVRVEERGAGEVGALVAAFNSMTRALEQGRRELLEQNERLRESEEHKRDLISMVSHEIRTPLASVCGFTSLLLEREFPRDEERRYLEIIDQQARRLAGIAGDFLDVQLLEGGGMKLERAPFDLVELTREQTHLFFSHSSHAVELDMPDGAVVVNGDRDRIAQVIGNLLSNAIKYSPPNAEVRVSLRSENGDVRLSVVDEGMGIPPDDRDRVFEKFYRGADAASGIGGTGLGLSVAREIVTSHGGDIDLESETSRGSTFTVRLPVSG
jgi:signal transduction histidine kinase